MRACAFALVCTTLLAAPAGAQAPACGPRVTVSYYDSAPDLFVVRNLSVAGWSLVGLTIDLTGSLGNLVFDTDEGGEGAGSPEPFGSVEGTAVRLTGVRPPPDGGRSLVLRFEGFAAGESYTFQVDVDDRLTDSPFGQTHVAGAEMAGSGISVRLRGPSQQNITQRALFGENAEADTGVGGCV